jgi:hypothetical protein
MVLMHPVRDTTPCPAGIYCPHCDELAVETANLNAFAAFIGECHTCAHPGRVERDAVGALTWSLGTGRCNRGECKACSSALLDLLQSQVTPTNYDLLELPRAADLIAQAEALAIALGEPARVALRRIVDEFGSAAAIASQYLSEKELG